MTATLDKIKSFIDHPVSFVKLKQNDHLKDVYVLKEEVFGNAVPLTDDYYHPLNPCFLFELSGPGLIQHSSVITVRDGFITFMDFLLKNHQKIPLWGITFIIPISYEKLIPSHLKSFFLGYDFSQENKSKSTTEKLIYAHLSEEYLGEDIKASLEKINVQQGEKVRLFLSYERNLMKPFFESTFSQNFIFQLSQKLKGCHVEFISDLTFVNETDYSNVEFIDLAKDEYLVSDSFVKFVLASRGCETVFKTQDSKIEPIFKIMMSQFHTMNLYEIESTGQVFSEFLLYKKQNPHKEFLSDDKAKNLLRHLF